MDKMIYTVAQGANRIMMSQSMRANNLANADTVGFKADLERVTATPVDTNVDSFKSRVIPDINSNGFNHSNGQINHTGRELDLAIKGDGLFAVMGPEGQESYTRNGAIDINPDGNLTVNGMDLLGDGGAIIVPANSHITIGNDGTVTAGNNGIIQNVGRLKLVNPDLHDIYKGTDGLFHSNNDQPLNGDNRVKIESGGLEESNVSAVSELLACMDLSRQFEIQIKLMKKADEMAQASNRLLNA